MATSRDIAIRVPVLARVEGEGGLEIDIHDGRIRDLKLRIFEPPRFFEKLVEGRDHTEVPDLVARICGICPVAYQMSAVHALEGIFGIDPGPWVRAMRRVFYCGEWLESHNLHIHLLAAPDYFGYASVLELAGEYPEEVRRGLRLQRLGNDILRLFGGRSVHPVGARVGGFHHAPGMEQVARLRAELRDALPLAEALVQWTASLALPHHSQEFVSVALRHGQEYPFNEGRLVASDGLDIPIDAYEEHFTEEHLAHSTALHGRYHGSPYLVGPLARVNLNWDRLPAQVRGNAERAGVVFPSDNMFHSIIARAIEVHFALVEALRVLDDYALPDRPYVEAPPRAGVGFGCTEAPRGMLWQRWETDGEGRIRAARIVPPTSQNQPRMEEDLRLSLEALGLEHSDDSLRLRAEMVIRNYDPCISCATHFLKLQTRRS